MEHPSRAAEAVAEQLVGEVIASQYAPGARLPGERALAERFGVSRMTMRAALHEVAAKGLIHASPQRGWYVVETTVSEPPTELQSFTEMAHALGLTPSSTIIRRRERTASLDEALDLGVAPSSPVIDIRRLRRLNGRPVTVEDLLFPQALFPWLMDINLEDQSVYALLAQHGHEMSHSRYTVHAENASPALAQQLQLPRGGAVLVAREVAHDARGTVVLLGENHYRGDAYRFTANLWRKR